ncbi:MAG TPA: hypothetical protein VIK18_14575, partial [Pirellulales bacterium]
IEYVQRLPKRYTGTFLLGRQSTTEDIEGEVVELPDARRPTRDELEHAAARLLGTIQQRPPQFSALKVAGRRAYELARRGEQVDLAPREVRIDRCQLVEFDYPQFVLEIACSGGTYVRSLGRDLAESVGSAAVMSALVRTGIGHFELANAWPLEHLNADTLAEAMLPAAEAVRELPAIVLSPAEAIRISLGQTITMPAPEAAEELAAFDEQGRLVSILRRRGDGSLGPIRNFPV